MRGDKLISLLKVLKDEEKEALLKFSEIDLHNNKKGVSFCLRALCNKLSSEQNTLESDEALFSLCIEQKEVFNDEKLRDLMYFSTLLVNDFIVYLEHKNNQEFQETAYTNFLQQRGLYKLQDQVLKKRIKQINGKKVLNAEDYLKLFELSKQRYLIGEENKFKKGFPAIENALDSLDHYYFTEKLKWSHELLGSELVAAHKYEFPFLDEVLTEVNKAPYKKNQYISVYYLITLFYKKNISKDSYLVLKSAILDILPNLKRQEKRSIIIDLHNYAIKLYTLTGNFEEIHEIHEVNELGIKHDAFYKNGKFGNHNVLNIANVALRLDKTDWMTKFLKKIKNKVEDQNIIKIIEAMTAFQLGQYSLVQEKLNDVDYEDVYFAMTAKAFLAKTYFLQKEYNLLDSHLKAMEQFYRRSKILSEPLIESNLNFVLTLRKMMKHVNTPSKLTNIYRETEGVYNMAYKAWVHSTLKQLLT